MQSGSAHNTPMTSTALVRVAEHTRLESGLDHVKRRGENGSTHAPKTAGHEMDPRLDFLRLFQLICGLVPHRRRLVARKICVTTGSGSLGLSLVSTWSSTTVWGSWCEINVLLRVQSHHERWDVDDLLTNGNVSLGDQDSGVVDGLGKTKLENLGLQSSLKEILNLQGQNVIQLHSVFWQDTDSDQSSDQGVTFEKSLRVLLVSGQQVSGGSSDLGQLETNSIDFVLVLQTVFTGEFKLGVQSSGLSTYVRILIGSLSFGAARHGDVRVVLFDDRVHILDVERSHITHLLDLVGDLLDLVVRQVEVQLLDSALDSVPSRQSVGKVDVSGESEIFRIQDLVGGWVGQDSLGVNTGLVGEGAETGDWVVERNVHLDNVGHQVLQVADLV
ncbi:hypothetical protein OGAPHI_002395 [Ogataea philodendri]|uniref:Uncharacterized protein n=1 Tax=Ogataea philodendri TaxID=1378263 RepID=A0A9P8T797_9ASCO|nr:uncharacterized protein OGAPHI_002395 [Ogataea philodendri]KAH3668641.1 hypothetical protein OGAPHI_002395 [Ogataea philodendri]